MFSAKSLGVSALIAVSLLLTAATASAQRTDPLISNVFALEVQGLTVGYFTECSGMGSESEIVEHKVISGGTTIVQKIPGRLIWTDITCKRGLTSNIDLWTWRQQVVDGNMSSARKDAAITLFDQTLKPVAKWEVLNSWPSKLVAEVANASAVEQITIVSEQTLRVAAQ